MLRDYNRSLPSASTDVSWGMTIRWRTASFALKLGIAVFVVLAAMIGAAQGIHVSAPGPCISSTVDPLRALPWLFVAWTPFLTYKLVRAYALREQLAPVAVGTGPYRQSLLGDARIIAPRSHDYVRVLFALLALGLGAAQIRRRCPIALPASCHPKLQRIVLIPFGKIRPTVIDGLTKHFRDCYGLPVVTGPQMEAPASAWNSERVQWTAEELLTGLPGCREDDPQCDHLVIGVTDLDIYTTQAAWAFAFSIRDPKRSVAIVSMYRMTSPSYWDNESDRLSKMIAKIVAIDYCRLPISNDPHSVRFGHIGGSNQLDAIDESVW